MELLKLIGIALALLLLVFGVLALALARSSKVKRPDDGTISPNTSPFSGCGCGGGNEDERFGCVKWGRK